MRMNRRIARKVWGEYLSQSTEKEEFVRRFVEDPSRLSDEDLMKKQIRVIKENGQKLEHFIPGSLAKSPSIFSGLVIENEGNKVRVLYEKMHASGIYKTYEIDRNLELSNESNFSGGEEITINGITETARKWICVANKFESELK